MARSLDAEFDYVRSSTNREGSHREQALTVGRRSQLPDLSEASRSLRSLQDFVDRAGQLVGHMSHQATLGTSIGPWYRAKEVLRQRQRRADLFGQDLFSDPAWDLLLFIFSEKPLRDQVRVKDIQCSAQIPLSTTLRWIGTLEQRGLIWRREHEVDRRGINVGLTDRGYELMMVYFDN